MKILKLFYLLCFLSGTAQASFVLTPSDDARFGRHDPLPVFSWQAVDPSHHYFLDIGIDPDLDDYASIEITGSEKLDLASMVSESEWEPLSFRIYWRVRCSTLTSEIRSLTKTRLNAPRVDFPFDARFGPDDPAPVIQWTTVPEAAGYCIEFSGDKYFTDSVRLDWNSAVLNLGAEIQPDVWRTFSGYFYFRVWAKDESGFDGPFYQFFRLSKSILPTPSIGRPSGVYFPARCDPPEFVWGSVPGAAGYQIQIAPGGDWNSEYALIYSTSGNSLYLGDVMAREEWEMMWKVYRWRVAAVDPSGAFGPWSEDTLFYKCGHHVLTALGDSITTGGVCIEDSWFDWAGARWRRDYGHVTLFNAAVGGTKAEWGEDVIASVLQESYPEFILILFGANDAVDPGNCNPPYHCDVAEHLREMVYTSRMFGTIPIIATILPVNPDGPFAYNQFRVDMYNDEIRAMAQAEQVHLVDLNALAWAYGDISALFCDWGHPNEIGTDLIADAFYDAVKSYD